MSNRFGSAPVLNSYMMFSAECTDKQREFWTKRIKQQQEKHMCYQEEMKELLKRYEKELESTQNEKDYNDYYFMHYCEIQVNLYKKAKELTHKITELKEKIDG